MTPRAATTAKMLCLLGTKKQPNMTRLSAKAIPITKKGMTACASLIFGIMIQRISVDALIGPTSKTTATMAAMLSDFSPPPKKAFKKKTELRKPNHSIQSGNFCGFILN